MNADRGFGSRPVWTLAGLLMLAGFALAAAPQSQQAGNSSNWEPQRLSNQQRVDQLTGNELEKIKSRQRRIQQLPEPAQARLREIHRQWQEHPRRDELRMTMQGYYDWWKTLDDDERARIKSESGEQRLQVVRDIMQRRAEAIFGIAGETQLPKEDVTRLFEWSRECVVRKKDEIISLYRPIANRRRSRRQDLLNQVDQWEGLFVILEAIPDEQAMQLIEPSDIEILRAKLSSDAVAIIDAQDDDVARQKLVYRWVMSVVTAHRNQSVDERELMEFYDLEMTQRQRQMVDAMSPARRRAAISQMYRIRRRYPRQPDQFRPRPGHRSGNRPEFRENGQ